MEEKIRYLEMIQGIINRMASNSFMLRGWAVTLVSGVTVLAGEDTGWGYLLTILLPVVVFWGLDAYYLRQERLYRSLYDKARKMKKKEIDFSLAARPEEFGGSKNCYCSCLFSKTEVAFYGVLAVACIGLRVVIYMVESACRRI